MIYSKLFRCELIGVNRLDLAKEAFDEWTKTQIHTLKAFKIISASHTKSYGEASVLVVFETTTTLLPESIATVRVKSKPLNGAHFLD